MVPQTLKITFVLMPTIMMMGKILMMSVPLRSRIITNLVPRNFLGVNGQKSQETKPEISLNHSLRKQQCFPWANNSNDIHRCPPIVDGNNNDSFVNEEASVLARKGITWTDNNYLDLQIISFYKPLKKTVLILSSYKNMSTENSFW